MPALQPTSKAGETDDVRWSLTDRQESLLGTPAVRLHRLPARSKVAMKKVSPRRTRLPMAVREPDAPTRKEGDVE